MHPVQQHLFDTDFAGLSGSQVSGTLVLSEELINLGLTDFIDQLRADPAPTPAPAGTTSAPASAPQATPDPKALLAKLNIKQLKVRAQDGKFLLDLDVSVD